MFYGGGKANTFRYSSCATVRLHTPAPSAAQLSQHALTSPILLITIWPSYQPFPIPTPSCLTLAACYVTAAGAGGRFQGYLLHGFTGQQDHIPALSVIHVQGPKLTCATLVSITPNYIGRKYLLPVIELPMTARIIVYYSKNTLAANVFDYWSIYYSQIVICCSIF